MLSTAKPRPANSRIGTSGSSARHVCAVNAASSTRPAARQAQVAMLRQPHWPACCRPSTERVMPLHTSSAPRTSILDGVRSCAGLAISVKAIAISATGMLIQKIARHVHWVRYPPSIGPIDVRPPETEKKIASAFPRSCTG